MGLVDGEQCRAYAVDEIQRAFLHQPLRRDIQQVQLAVLRPTLDAAGLISAERRVQKRRAHPGLAQRVDLVLHQRDQR